MKIEETEGETVAPAESDALDGADETAESTEKDEADGDVEAEAAEADDHAGEKPASKGSGDAEDEDDEPKETKSQRKRRLRREREEALRRELAERDREIRALEAQVESLGDVDLGNADDYDAALAQNAVNRTLRAEREHQLKSAQDHRERAAAEANAARAEAWKEQVSELSHITDFAEKVYAESTPFTDAIVEAVTTMDRGPEVAYHLATHTEELRRLHGLDPTRLGMALGKIEASLTALKPKMKSSAPAPIRPVKGSAALSEPDLEKLDFESYRRARGIGV